MKAGNVQDQAEAIRDRVQAAGTVDLRQEVADLATLVAELAVYCASLHDDAYRLDGRISRLSSSRRDDD